MDPATRRHIYFVFLVAGEVVIDLEDAGVEDSEVPVLEGGAEAEVADFFGLAGEGDRVECLD